MELQLPKIKTIVLRDGTSAPFQLTRRRISTEKLPVPPGASLTLTRGKLGDGLCKPTTDFLRTGTCMNVPDPIYNNLHDPHLRHYFHRREKCNMLKEGNFITDDNEVICSLKDYNTYEEYLRSLKMVANKTYDHTQTVKMEMVMKLQKSGRIPRDVSLAEVVESILEEDTENLRELLQTEAAKKKLKGQMEVENESTQNEEALYTELDLLGWKAEDRCRLMLYEKQYRHEQNRKMYLKEVQELKDRRNQNLMDRKCATNQRKLQEKVKMSKEAEIKRSKTEGQDENFWLGEPQRLPPSKQCTRCPVLRSGPARVYGVNASEGFQKLPKIQRKGACIERKFPERTITSLESVIKECTAKLPDEDPSEPSLGEPQVLLPLRPRMGCPVLRSGVARVYGVKASEAYRKLPSLELCSDQS